MMTTEISWKQYVDVKGIKIIYSLVISSKINHNMNRNWFINNTLAPTWLHNYTIHWYYFFTQKYHPFITHFGSY